MPSPAQHTRHAAAPSQGDAKAQRPSSLKGRILYALPYIGIAVALVIMLYYPVTEAIDAYRRQQIAAQLADVVAEAVGDGTKQELLAQATAWNQQLAGLSTDIPEDEIWPYENQLSDGSTDAFCYLLIPSINLAMPVYHGLSDAVLSAGAGHSEDSSLPIGGASTHTVVSGHSGMERSRAFDDIRDLQVGDVFGFYVLGDWYCYRVTSTETVLPTEMDSLAIQAGEDLATLVTCTPYGLNTHRLLVHAQRCEVPEGFGETIPGPAEVVFTPRALPALIAIGVVVALVVAFAARSLYKKKRGRRSPR